MIEIKLQLKKAALNKGGDRYEGDCLGENLVVYFPQSITRASGAPAPALKLTVEV